MRAIHVGLLVRFSTSVLLLFRSYRSILLFCVEDSHSPELVCVLSGIFNAQRMRARGVTYGDQFVCVLRVS